jgi:hypothetical protein
MTRTLAVALIVSAALLSGADRADDSQAPRPADTSRPCPTEDSTGCTWNAATRGNGHGRSFTVTTDGTRHYFRTENDR